MLLPRCISNPSFLVVVFGKKGSGKTTYARRVIRRFERVIIIDPLLEYDDFPLERDYSKLSDYRMVRTLVEDEYNLAEFFHTLYSDNRFFGYLIVFEELHMYCGSKPYVVLSRFIRTMRHFNFKVITISQRPLQFPIIVSSQADAFVFFKITEPFDLMYIRGINHRLPKHIRKLENFEYIVYNV